MALMSDLMTVETAAQAAYIVAALLFILALAGLSHHESAQGWATPSASAGMTVALVATIALAVDRDISGIGLALLVGRDAGRGRDRSVACPGGRDDRDARADRPAALVRRSGRGAGRLERLPARRGATPTAPRPSPAASCRTCPGSTPPRWSSVSSSARSPSPGSIVAFLKLSARIKSTSADAARQERSEPRALVAFAALTVWFVDRPAAVAADRGHAARAAAGLAPGRLDRRRRHAGRGVDAEQLLRVGRRRVRLPARERPADHHRRPGRLLGCLPVLHHVQGDEPLVHLRHRRRVRHRGRPGRGHRLRRAPRDHRRGRR